MTLLKTENQVKMLYLNLMCFSEHLTIISFTWNYLFFLFSLLTIVMFQKDQKYTCLPSVPSRFTFRPVLCPAVSYGYSRVSPCLFWLWVVRGNRDIRREHETGKRKGQGVYWTGFLLSGFSYVVCETSVHSCRLNSMNFLSPYL